MARARPAPPPVDPRQLPLFPARPVASAKPGDRLRGRVAHNGPPELVAGAFLCWGHKPGGCALMDLDDGRRKWVTDLTRE